MRGVAIVVSVPLFLAAWARADEGGALYGRYCLACHGEAGDGKGPAEPWLWPKPRDFTKGRFKWRSTPSGKAPTDGDLERVIREGAPGTSMPGFDGILDKAQIAAVIGKVKGFAPQRFAKAGTPVAAPATPADLARRADKGKELFASLGCSRCHGEGGRGDGEAAADLKDAAGRPAGPYDLTQRPLRRGGGAQGIYLTLMTGLDGTPMATFDNRSSDDLWALAAYVESIRARDDRRERTAVEPQIQKDRWQSGLTIAEQGDPPASLPPAAASLAPAQCGRCHAKQYREWSGTIHASAASPGLLAQFESFPDIPQRCQRCHAPLAEQLGDADLRAGGLTCAGCHVRNWTRRGPPLRADSGLLAIASYPFAEDSQYERSDFCLPCHQSAPDDALDGRPLLNTYREWLEGPYMRRGVQCQHCHMPDREHTWKGVHDAETVKQGVKVTAAVERTDQGVTVTVKVTNIGAGHYLPTTPTPQATLTVAVGSASKAMRIGRALQWSKTGWKELEDTRIPPGETLTFAPTFSKGEVGESGRVAVQLTMWPDAYYAGFYKSWLASKTLSAEARAQFQAAWQRANGSRFTVWEKSLPLPK